MNQHIIQWQVIYQEDDCRLVACDDDWEETIIEGEDNDEDAIERWLRDNGCVSHGLYAENDSTGVHEYVVFGKECHHIAYRVKGQAYTFLVVDNERDGCTPSDALFCDVGYGADHQDAWVDFLLRHRAKGSISADVECVMAIQGAHEHIDAPYLVRGVA